MDNVYENLGSEIPEADETTLREEELKASVDSYYRRIIQKIKDKDLKPDEGFNRAGNVFLEKYGRELKDDLDSEILDVGCGLGRNTIALAKEGFKVKGVDLSEVAVRYCEEIAKREGLSIEFKEGSLVRLPYEDSSFTALLGVGVYMGHQKDYLRDSLAEAARVLKNNGILFFNGNLVQTENVLRETQEKGLIRYFEKPLLLELLEGTGLIIESLTHSERMEGGKVVKVSHVGLRKK